MSRTAVLVLAAASGWGLARLLGSAHPFATTLGMLPLVVTGLVLLGRSLGRPLGWTLGYATGGFALLAAAVPSLAVPGLARMVAAAGVVLLTAATVRLLPGLRRRLDKAPLSRPDLAFLLLPLLVYLAVMPWAMQQRPPDGDEPYYLLIAHSLVHDLDVDLHNNYAQGDSLSFMPRRLEPQLGDPKGRDGHWFSRHDVLFPALAALPYAAGGLQGVLALMALLAATLGWLTLRLARYHLDAKRDGLFRAWCLMMFLSPLVLYSHQVWIEVPAALLLVLALDAILALDGGRPRPGSLLAALLPIVLLPPLKLRLALLAGPLAAFAWWRSGRDVRLGLLLAGPLAAVSAALLAFNTWFYGRALKVYEFGDLGLFEPPFARYARHLVGLLFDLSFGLFALAPAWLLLLPALVIAVRRRDAHLGLLLAVAGPYFFLLLSRREWYGGWSPAFRYGLVALPLLALVLAPAIDRARGPGWRLLGRFGVVVGVIVVAAMVAVPGWSFNFADGSSRLVDAFSSRLGADVARLLPSGIRPRTATWLASGTVAALTVALALAWRGPARWRQTGAALGTGLAVLLPSAFGLAATKLPTCVVEAEDAWVARSEGAPHPSLWTPDRARFRGGWSLPAGGEIRAPIVAGGTRAHLVVTLRAGFNTEAPIEIVVRAGDVELARRLVPLKAGESWERLDFGVVDWPRGATLVVEIPRSDRRRLRNFVVFDRIDIRWLD